LEENKLYKPIFIIGGVRSGTTILGEILSQDENIAYWLEPKYIWKYRKPSNKSDLRAKGEANRPIKKYIQNRFLAFKNQKGKNRFMEKTPSNVFRVPFIYEIFPNGLFIQIIRNGKDTILSAEKKWTTRMSGSAIKRRLFSNEIPLLDIPFYFFVAIRDVIAKFFFPKKGFIWGQLFEGIHDYRKEHSVIETCAKQWVTGIQIANQELKKLPKEQVFTLKYEDLVEKPKKTLEPLIQFLELEPSKIIQYAEEEVFSTKHRIYSEKQKEKLASVEYIINDEMKTWGY